jgi:hypothetical protein
VAGCKAGEANSEDILQLVTLPLPIGDNRTNLQESVMLLSSNWIELPKSKLEAADPQEQALLRTRYSHFLEPAFKQKLDASMEQVKLQLEISPSAFSGVNLLNLFGSTNPVSTVLPGTPADIGTRETDLANIDMLARDGAFLRVLPKATRELLTAYPVLLVSQMHERKVAISLVNQHLNRLGKPNLDINFLPSSNLNDISEDEEEGSKKELAVDTLRVDGGEPTFGRVRCSISRPQLEEARAAILTSMGGMLNGGSNNKDRDQLDRISAREEALMVHTIQLLGEPAAVQFIPQTVMVIQALRDCLMSGQYGIHRSGQDTYAPVRQEYVQNLRQLMREFSKKEVRMHDSFCTAANDAFQKETTEFGSKLLKLSTRVAQNRAGGKIAEGSGQQRGDLADTLTNRTRQEKRQRGDSRFDRQGAAIPNNAMVPYMGPPGPPPQGPPPHGPPPHGHGMG